MREAPMNDPLDEELTRMVGLHIEKFGAEPVGDGGGGGGGASPARPKLDLSQPIGYRPPRDEELEGLQKKAKGAREDAKLGKAVADFAERPTNFLDYAQKLGGGGVSAAPAKNEAWKDGINEADAAIGDLRERRASEGAMAASADESDPNSPTAQTYRSVLLKFAPDLAEKLKGANAKQMRTMAPWLEKFHAENSDLLQADAAAKAKAIQQAKTDAEKGAALDWAKKNRAEDVTDRRANTAATREQTAAALGMRQGEIAKKASDDVKDDVKELAKTLPGDLNDFTAKYNRIKARLASSSGDIPGVGIWDSNKPKALRSTEDFDMQKDAGQMLAAYQKLITGAGASDDERKNLAKISLDLDNEKSFAAGLESLNEAYAAKVKQVRAGFATPVLSQYDANTQRGQTAAKAVDHYLVSPDKKRRVPVYADGTEGPEEAQ